MVMCNVQQQEMIENIYTNVLKAGKNYKTMMIPEYLTDSIPHEEGPVNHYHVDLSMDLCCSNEYMNTYIFPN